MFDDFEVITAYTLQEALDDGVLVAIFKDEWEQLSEDKPIVATAAIVRDVPEWRLQTMWKAFVLQREADRAQQVRPLLVTQYNGETIWVIEDGASITYMYPHEY